MIFMILHEHIYAQVVYVQVILLFTTTQDGLVKTFARGY